MGLGTESLQHAALADLALNALAQVREAGKQLSLGQISPAEHRPIVDRWTNTLKASRLKRDSRLTQTRPVQTAAVFLVPDAQRSPPVAIGEACVPSTRSRPSSPVSRPR